MIKLKGLLKEWNDTSFKKLPKTWSKNVNDTRDGLTERERKEAYGFNSGGQTKVTNPINQKYDFKKPTVVSMDKSKIQTLIKTGRLETDGLTIIYEE